MRLTALATRALRKPERVIAALNELLPMAAVGPITLDEVRLVLGRRLTDLVVLPEERAAGYIFVAPVDAARGLTFDVVFVPGLAEALSAEGQRGSDPARSRAPPLGLDTNEQRVERERLALRLAVGAARERIVLSYPRVDMDQSRPRVPSFYGLEVIRAAEGKLPGFDELARRAELTAAPRASAGPLRRGCATPSTTPSTTSRSSRPCATGPRSRRWGTRTTSSAPIPTSRGPSASALAAGT